MENNPLSVRMFQSAKSTLNRINNINCLETFLYSHYLGLAGRVDCIAEFDGELAVIDFKTSTKKTSSCTKSLIDKLEETPLAQRVNFFVELRMCPL